MIFKNFNIKERIFLLYMLFFSGITALTVVINLIIGLEFMFNYKWIAVCLTTATFAVLAYNKIYIELIHRLAIYLLCFILLPLCWLYSQGLLSPATIYTPLLFLLANFIIKGRERVFINILLTIMVMILIWLYYNMGYLYKSVPTQVQYIDWMTYTPLILGFLSALLITFEKAYEEERISNAKRQELLEIMAKTDNLTGLFNRNEMESKLSLIHSVFERGGGNYSIVLLDIDDFKQYNDIYGHIAGDKCLQKVGNIIENQLKRGTDWGFRYGGEEFLILLGFTHQAGAQEISETILKALNSVNIEHKGSKVNSRITASLGISTSKEGDLKPLEVINRADKALYFSKQSGKNRVSIG